MRLGLLVRPPSRRLHDRAESRQALEIAERFVEDKATSEELAEVAGPAARLGESSWPTLAEAWAARAAAELTALSARACRPRRRRSLGLGFRKSLCLVGRPPCPSRQAPGNHSPPLQRRPGAARGVGLHHRATETTEKKARNSKTEIRKARIFGFPPIQRVSFRSGGGVGGQCPLRVPPCALRTSPACLSQRRKGRKDERKEPNGICVAQSG